MLLLTGKGVYISILACIFLGYFGYPSYVKYKNHDTVFTETRVKFDPQKPVGITIYAWRKTLFNGWKDKEGFIEGFINLCNESSDFKIIFQCINNGTFKHDDIIEKYEEVTYVNETIKRINVTNNTIYTVDC